jgi:hypothetical protein
MELKYHRYDVTDVDVFNVFYNAKGEVYIEPKTWMWHYIPCLETKQLLYHDS